jgi:pimeloyl-ACP methyl ester carboxylesterase
VFESSETRISDWMRHINEWTTINGLRLYWQDWGSKRAPAILMLHGLTQQSHTFDHVADCLSARYRCIALDFRGRGESEWADPETYTIPHSVDDVIKLLDELALPAVHVLGTSLGGLCGLSLGAFSSKRVLSSALNDSGPEIDPAGAQRIASRRCRGLGDGALPLAAAAAPSRRRGGASLSLARARR